jgi:hypothetical protein
MYSGPHCHERALALATCMLSRRICRIDVSACDGWLADSALLRTTAHDLLGPLMWTVWPWPMGVIKTFNWQPLATLAVGMQSTE